MLSEIDIRLTSNEVRQAILELSVFLNSGISLSAALESMVRSDVPALATFADNVLRRIESGRPLSTALAQCSKSLSPVIISTIRAGEHTGRLALVLHELSLRLDKLQRGRAQLFSALLYPAGIFIVTSGILVFMTSYMLPRLLQVSGSALNEPPWPTKVLIAVSGAGIPLAFLALIAVCSVPWFFSAVPNAIKLRKWILFESPLIGRIGRSLELARFCGDISLMLDTGLTLEQALMASNPMDPRLQSGVQALLRQLRMGQTFAKASLELSCFPPGFSSFVKAGEESGNLPKLLSAQGIVLETDAELRLSTLIRLLEPAALGILGAVVGFVVLGSFLPIYQLISSHL